jgi:hypothetical protein
VRMTLRLSRRLLSTKVRPIAVQHHGSASNKVLYSIDSEANKIRMTNVNLPAGHYSLAAVTQRFLETFLPENHHTSVRSNYIPYVSWQAVSSVANSASGVLSTQSLLFAVGLGAGSIPLAAALNWIIKDGLGQIGGVAFASWVNQNNKLDAEPKKYRVFAGICMDIAGIMEILSPLAPSYFLLIASVSNIGKNIAWMTMSATKAGIHRNFILKENLGDVTAKSASQTTACSVVGTGIGILLSTTIGTEVSHLLAAFTALSVVHMVSNYISLKHVAVHTFNHQRLERLITNYFNKAKCDERIVSPQTVGQTESFVLPYKTILNRGCIESGVQLDKLFVSQEQLHFLQKVFKGKSYLISVAFSDQGTYSIRISWSVDAGTKDLIESYYFAGKLSKTLENSDTNLSTVDLPKLLCGVEVLSEEFAQFVGQLKRAGWDTKHAFLESNNYRYQWIQGTETDANQ